MADAVPLPMILRDILKKWPPDQPDIVTWDGLLDAALTAEFATALPFREIAQAYVDNFDSARG